MNVTFYKNNSDKRVITKTLTGATTASGVSLYDSTSVTAPVLKMSGGASKIANFNYVYISDFWRYYYITDFTVENGYILISCKVDVLMSYATSIKECDCIAKRSASDYNFYLNDERFLTYQYDKQYIHKFNTPFSKLSNFILVTQGG